MWFFLTVMVLLLFVAMNKRASHQPEAEDQDYEQIEALAKKKHGDTTDFLMRLIDKGYKNLEETYKEFATRLKGKSLEGAKKSAKELFLPKIKHKEDSVNELDEVRKMYIRLKTRYRQDKGKLKELVDDWLGFVEAIDTYHSEGEAWSPDFDEMHDAPVVADEIKKKFKKLLNQRV